MSDGGQSVSQSLGQQSPRSRLAANAWLLVLPLVFVAFSLYLQAQRGPHWLASNSDPDYVYLLNAAAVATLHSPGHTDHPGTPVQLLGAVVLRMTHLTAGQNELAADVVNRPELYLTVFHRTMLGLYTAMLVLAGWALMRFCNSPPLALCLQLTPWLSVSSMNAMTRVMPEPMLLTVSAGLAAILLIHAQAGRQVHARQFTIGYAIVIGLAVATKVTALPLAVIPLLMLPNHRSRGWYAAGALMSFVVLTLPMISRYKGFAVWLMHLFTHTGKYGSKEAGFPETGVYLQSIVTLCRQEPVLTGLVLLAGAAAVWGLMNLHTSDEGNPKTAHSRVLLAVVSAQLLQLIVVAKHPDPRYLVPALGLLGINAALVWQRITRSERRPWLRLCVVAMLLVAAAIVHTRGLRRLNRALEAQRAAHERVAEAAVSRGAAAKRIYYYGASAIPYALQFGDRHCNSLFAKEIATEYPDVYYYDIWEPQYTDAGGEVDIEAVLESATETVMQGRPFVRTYTAFRPSELELSPIIETRIEALYRVEPVKREQ